MPEPVFVPFAARRPLHFGSLFAGIGGFDAGFIAAGMRSAFAVERDETCNRVRRRHWPSEEQHSDVTEFSIRSTRKRPRVLCGGFPCQDLSVAGKRGGLAGERSGLFFHFVRLIGEFAPEWVVIENVPGLLSSWSSPDAPPSEIPVGRRWERDETSDFAVVVSALVELGYGVAWRVLDSQYFGVAQRRERVIIVGHSGKRARRPFFDPRRSACLSGQILFEPESVLRNYPPRRCEKSNLAGTIDAGAGVRRGAGINPGGIVESMQASTPLVPVAYRTSGNSGVMEQGNRTAALNCGSDPTQNIILTPFDTTQLTSPGNYSNPQPGQPCHPLAAGAHSPAVAFAIQERAVSENPDNGPQGIGWKEEVAFTIESRHHQQAAAYGMAVRRLTPRECERLQGFEDDWTRYSHDGKKISDSARYRMLGNAVTRTVGELIGRRIVEAACTAQ